MPARRLVSSPLAPVHVADLPAAAMRVVEGLHFPHLRFAELTTVSAASLRP